MNGKTTLCAYAFAPVAVAVAVAVAVVVGALLVAYLISDFIRLRYRMKWVVSELRVLCSPVVVVVGGVCTCLYLARYLTAAAVAVAGV
jgi:hypothetical protein